MIILPSARVLLAAVIFLSFVFLPRLRGAENISPLGRVPDWASFEKYQETITRDEFVRLLQEVYCTRGVNPEFIKVEETAAQFLIDRDAQSWFPLRFAPDEQTRQKFTTTAPRAAALPPAR